MLHRAAVVLAGLIALLAGRPAAADFQVATQTFGHQGHRAGRAVGTDAAGNFVVVWDGQRYGYSGQAIYARRFDAAAQPLGPDFVVSATPNHWEGAVAVRPDGSGFAVAWQGGSPTSWIWARTFDGNGNPLTPEFRVNTSTSFDQHHADVAIDAAGRFTVVWASADARIRGRRFGMDGSPLGSEFIVHAYTSGSFDTPRVAARATGEFVVTWWGRGPDDADGVFARRFAADGTPVGLDFRANEGTQEIQGTPNVAMAADGRFMVVWEDVTANDLRPRAVLGRRFDAAGTPDGPDIVIDATPFSDPFWMRSPKPGIVSSPDGGFAVVYTHPAGMDTMAVRVAPTGIVGPPFRLNSYTTGYQLRPAVAPGPVAGEFVATWTSDGQDGSGYGVFGTRFSCAPGNPAPFDDAATGGHGAPVTVNVLANDFDPHGLPLAVIATGAPSPGGAVAINADRSVTYTPPPLYVGTATFTYTVENPCGATAVATVTVELTNTAPLAVGDSATTLAGVPIEVFVLANDSDPDGDVIRILSVQSPTAGGGAAALDDNGTPGDPSDDRIDYAPPLTGASFDSFEYTIADGPGATATTQVSVTLVVPAGLVPAGLAVDAPAGGGGDGNRVFEPGETAPIAPRWENATLATFAVSGHAAGLAGAPGAIVDATGTYPTMGPGAAADCAPPCYAISIPVVPGRPLHWDAAFDESLSNGDGTTWTLHLGDSFRDVPRASPFYRFVETVLHHQVTAGCTAADYCPQAGTTRAQLAVFALVSREGPAYVPAACGTPMFADVPATNAFCRWIEELARRGVVAGCGGGNYCPAAGVTREQMAVFMLATREGNGYVPPACGAPLFTDVPASSPFCRWIEELARRGVVGGCGGGNYCPLAGVTREQMSVFLAGTFGLTLYGP